MKKIKKPSGKKEFLLLIFLVCASLQISYSQINISGTVSDAADGSPLPGVNIIETGTSNGTVTDLNGKYNITVAGSSSSLTFSFVGYSPETISVDEQTIIDVSLGAGIGLEELVVVGFGTQKKESVVGAISQVVGDELVSAGTYNVSTAIEGKLSGVVTLQSDGKPGEEDPTIFIRGRSTWNSSSPLIMVDGVERTSWTDIDPNEITSISVLKDASATAVYGAKGGNGVILITTKRGLEGKPKFNISYTHGFKQVTDNMKMLNSYETITRFNDAMRNDNLWNKLYSPSEIEHYRLQDMPDIYPSVDWVSEMFKVGHADNANLNVSGGTERINYFVSLGYLFDGDILTTEKQGDFDPRNYYNRYNFRSNLEFKLSGTTTLKTHISSSVQKRNRPSTMNRSGWSLIWKSIYESAVNSSPTVYPASLLEQYPDPNEPDASGARYVYNVNGQIYDNPISQLNTTGFEHQSQTILNTDLILEQNLEAITSGLSARASLSYGNDAEYLRTYGQGAFTLLTPRYRLTVFDDNSYLWERLPQYYDDVPQLAFSGESQISTVRNLYYDVQVNYDRTFGSNHYVTALGVFRRKQVNRGSQEPFKEEAWSGRITYAYKLKYLFETNLGYTGSEQFAPGNRFGFFPAFAVGWNIAEEGFVKNNLAFINRLKLRYSYGRVGVDNGARWLYYQSYSEGAATGAWYARGILGAYGIWDPYTSSYIEGAVANSIAQWETAVKQNIGFEFGIIRKLNLSLDLFSENRDNILETPQTIPDFASLSFKELNIGKTKSHGYEIEINYTDQIASNLRLQLGGIFSFSENRVLFRDDPPGLPDYQKSEGFPIGQPRDLLENGRYHSVDDINNYVQPGTNVSASGIAGYPSQYYYGIGDDKFIDYNGDGVIDSNDEVATGFPTYPMYSYSFRALIRYKGLAFRFMIQGQQNKSSSVVGISLPFGTEYPYLYEHQLDYYSSNNPDAFYPSIHLGTYGASNYNNPKYSQPNSSFARLKEIELSYTFQSLKNKGIDNLTLFVNAHNLFTYAPNIYFGDPEKSFLQPGQAFSYPLLTRYNVGFRFGF